MWTVNNTSLDKRFNTYYSLSEINLFYIFKINIFFVVSLAYCSTAEGKGPKQGNSLVVMTNLHRVQLWERVLEITSAHSGKIFMVFLWDMCWKRKCWEGSEGKFYHPPSIKLILKCVGARIINLILKCHNPRTKNLITKCGHVQNIKLIPQVQYHHSQSIKLNPIVTMPQL